MTRPARPHILYLHSHDTGRFAEPYGHAVPTPAMQRLADEGVVFRRAFAEAWHGRRAVAVELDADLPAHLRTRQSLGDDRPVPDSAHFLHWDKTNAPGTPIEHFVVNLATKSDGFVIRGNHMGRNTVAGIKMKASNGLIADNRFESHGWCCLSLLNNLKWQEAFAPRNLRITGNRFENRFGVHAACSYPVAVDPSLSPPWIRGIDLRGNRFCPGPDGWAIQTHHTRRCCFDGGFID